MSRALTLAAAGVALPAVSVGGYFLYSSKNVDFILEDTFDKFKKNGLSGCIRGLFGVIGPIGEASKGATDVSGASKVESLGTSGKAEGCLVVNWNKETKESKWKGNWRFLWAMKKGDKGFVVFNTLTSSNDSSKNLKWDGGAYYLEKKEKNWAITKKKDAAKDKTVDKDGFDTKFPKANTSLKGMQDKSNWKFLEGKDSLENMCTTTDECKNSTESAPLRAYWKWVDDSSKSTKASEWSSNLNE